MNLILVLMDGSSKGHRARLELGSAVIGRARGNAVRLPSEKVSRRHCRLWLARGKVWVEDLGSQNGTFVNDDAVTGKVEVHPGDELRLSHLRFRVQFQPEKPSEEKTDPIPVIESDVLGIDEFDGGDIPLLEEPVPMDAETSMSFPVRDPFDFKNILQELDEGVDD